MEIVVCIKQVPDTTEIKINPVTGTLIRDGVPSIMNPDDKGGLELALRMKDQYGAHVTVITMGPPQADLVLREALAMGADDAILLTDRKFAGADTLATSNAFAIRTVQNLEVYVSFGIDAIDLQGEGMQSLVKVGDEVKKGDPILNIALNQIEDKIKSTITSMIVVKSSGKIEKITTASGKAKASNTPCVWVTLQKEASPDSTESENPQT